MDQVLPPDLPKPTARKSTFRRWFGSLFAAIDLTRRVVVNALFLFLVLAVLVALFSGGKDSLQPNTTLVIDPKGAIVEQYTTKPLDRALGELLGDPVEETRLRDIVRALEAAATEPNITQVLLVPHGITRIGQATTRELAAALQAFRRSGKKLVAYGEDYDQRTYLLAAQADEVLLHPNGGVLLEGLGRYRTYFKDAFDKFGIEAHLFRVGEYKSAGEPFVRSDSSPEADEADLYWMNDLWTRHLADIAAARKLEVGTLVAQIDDYPNRIREAHGDLANLAQSQGLVDALVTRDELEARLAASGAPGENGHGFRKIHLNQYLQLLDEAPTLPKSNTVAIVVAEGEIVDGDGEPGTIGGDSTSALLRQAREDENVKAVVLRVNSPGGSVFPSELIRREVELIKAAGKPIVVSMGDVAASGGYWISMNADRIFADPSTVTGSIGIFGLFINVPKAMSKLGLNTDGVGTTWLAGALDPTRPLDSRVGEMIQAVIDDGYRDFISKVAAARGRDESAIDAVARGRVWSGAQAKERGLIDAFGGLKDAVVDAAQRAGIAEDYTTRYMEPEPTFFERLMVDASRAGAVRLLQELGLASPTSWVDNSTRRELGRLQRLLRARKVQGVPVLLQAHCECGLP